jgi:PAS domain S-box-containing protein
MKERSTTKADLFPYLLQNHPCPMWIFDHQTLRFLEVNAAAIANYGYSRSEFLKMKITEIRPQDQVPKLLAQIRPFRHEGAQVTEWQHLTKNRRLIDVEIIASQFYFKGRPAVFTEVHDLTHRKEVDQIIIGQLEAAQNVMANNPSQARRYIKYAEFLARQSLKRSRQSLSNYPPTIPSCETERVKLTLREKEVLQLLADGKSNKEIAAALDITEGTVKIHVNHILRKLGTTARMEAAILAIKTGMVRI